MLNWLARYAPAVRALEDAGPLGSILDVGCGVHGLACVRPDLPFVGVDVEFGAPTAPSMVGFRIQPGPLPWPDGAFDTVICLDSLEHIPQPDRPGFVAELGRVAAKRLLIACPSSAAQPFDDLVRARYRMPDGSPPPWLVEHYEEGLPTPAEIVAAVRAVPGMTPSEVPMPDGLLCALMLIGDLDPGFSRQAFDEAAAFPGEWSAVLDQARFGSGFRPAFLLSRDEPARAVVDASDLAGSATAALTDRSAAQRVPAAETAAPAAAGRVEEERQPLATSRTRRLWLQPDWAEPLTWVPALSTYMRSATAEADVVLCLDGADETLSAGQVEALVATACEQLAGERPFADVLLMGTEVIRDGLERVDGPADVRARLGAPNPDAAFTEVDRLWAQVLLDGLRRQTDDWRHGAAPVLEPTVDPMLSVVVLEGGAGAAALARTVASVRAVHRPRIELVVASSGEDAPSDAGLDFNLSRSGGLALVAVGPVALGVDIERVVPLDVPDLARAHFSAREQAALAALPAEAVEAAFFRCWTRKEAFVKATGEGLARPLDGFDVAVDPEPILLATRPDAAEAGRWRLHALDAAPGYAASLCVAGRGAQVRLADFEPGRAASLSPPAPAR